MAKKKSKKPTKKELKEAGFVEGYDVKWMKEIGDKHPDYEKVKKAAKKAKIW